MTSDHARSGELDVSLLERLFDRSIYSPKNYKISQKPFTNLVKVRIYICSGLLSLLFLGLT